MSGGYFTAYGAPRLAIVRDALDREADRLAAHLEQGCEPESTLTRAGVYERAKALTEAHEMWQEAAEAWAATKLDDPS